MSTGVPLSELVHDLRAEVKHSLNPGQGTNTEEALMYLLNRVQQQLWIEYDWPTRRASRYVQVTAKTPWYAYPDGMSFDGIAGADFCEAPEVSGTATWHKLEYNITPADFATSDSDLAIKYGRPTKWDHNPKDNGFLLWPNPPVDGWVRFHGLLDVPQMKLASDVCTLDSVLIVLRAAAELAARQKMADAEIKMKNADKYANRLLAKQRSVKSPTIVIGSRDSSDPSFCPNLRPGIDYIP